MVVGATNTNLGENSPLVIRPTYYGRLTFAKVMNPLIILQLSWFYITYKYSKHFPETVLSRAVRYVSYRDVTLDFVRCCFFWSNFIQIKYNKEIMDFKSGLIKTILMCFLLIM